MYPSPLQLPLCVCVCDKIYQLSQKISSMQHRIFDSYCYAIPQISSTCSFCITKLLPAKVCLVKAIVFPVVMYGCERRTIKKAESRRIDAFELWCWRRLLRVSWTTWRSNQSILKGISPEYSLEGLMLKLKLQYFGHLMQRADSLEKTLMLGKIEGRRRGNTG